jgi:hypothetical protein
MRVLLDTNVTLDLLLELDPWRAEAEAIADADGRLQAHARASSITDIYYISRKLVGADRDQIRPPAAARAATKRL